jgi:hypothetical protein
VTDGPFRFTQSVYLGFFFIFLGFTFLAGTSGALFLHPCARYRELPVISPERATFMASLRTITNYKSRVRKWMARACACRRRCRIRPDHPGSQDPVEHLMTENYDVVVIGAGPAGYVAAIRAAQLKQKVAIVDRQWLGGVCLNVGCIPSKSLLKNAEVAHILRERGKDFGFTFENLKLDYGVALKRSRQNSERLVKGVGFLMKKNAITVYTTCGFTYAVTVTDASRPPSWCQNVIIATGAAPWCPQAGRPMLTES